MRRLAALCPDETIGADAIARGAGRGRAAPAEARRGRPGRRPLAQRGGAPYPRLPRRARRRRRRRSDIYDRVIAEVERPLIRLTLAATRGNQIKAAAMLGLNRNTLRKKIRDLDIPVVRGLHVNVAPPPGAGPEPRAAEPPRRTVAGGATLLRRRGDILLGRSRDARAGRARPWRSASPPSSCWRAARRSACSAGRRASALVLANLSVLLLLGAVLAGRLTRVWAERRRGSAGSRLHVRLVLLFGGVAVAPSDPGRRASPSRSSISASRPGSTTRCATAITESLQVARGYLEEHRNNIRAVALEMANDLTRAGAVAGRPTRSRSPRCWRRRPRCAA